MSHAAQSSREREVAGQSSNAAETSTSSLFLEIPLEVRRNIYKSMLGLTCLDHLTLLCVNKQVYREARGSFYCRPLECKSQEDLVQFVEEWPENVLQSITNLQLRLEEIPPNIMQRHLADIANGIPMQTHRHPYFLEIDRITTALLKLPSITHLQFLRPHSREKNISSSIVMTQVLNWTAEHYPGLHSLRLDIEQCHIDCLGSFTELRSLRLAGYSETSSTRTADVLGKLTSLEELTVIGPPLGLHMRQRHGFQTKIVQSITHQLFERIRSLKRLTLSQTTDVGADTRVFLTPKIMKALYEIHRESLRVLNISSSTTPTPAFIEYLSAFLLGTTNIQELSLTWPNMETTFVDCIPNSVRRLELVVTSRDHGQAFVERLLLMRYRLRYLEHIKFHVINPVHEISIEDEETDELNPLPFSLPIQTLAADIRSPFKISWGIWQPVLSD